MCVCVCRLALMNVSVLEMPVWVFTEGAADVDVSVFFMRGHRSWRVSQTLANSSSSSFFFFFFCCFHPRSWDTVKATSSRRRNDLSKDSKNNPCWYRETNHRISVRATRQGWLFLSFFIPTVPNAANPAAPDAPENNAIPESSPGPPDQGRKDPVMPGNSGEKNHRQKPHEARREFTESKYFTMKMILKM